MGRLLVVCVFAVLLLQLALAKSAHKRDKDFSVTKDVSARKQARYMANTFHSSETLFSHGNNTNSRIQWTVPPKPSNVTDTQLSIFFAFRTNSGNLAEPSAARAVLSYNAGTGQWYVSCEITMWESSDVQYRTVSQSSSPVAVSPGDRIEGIIATDGFTVTTTINVNGIFATHLIYVPEPSEYSSGVWFGFSEIDAVLAVGYSAANSILDCASFLPSSGHVLFYNLNVNGALDPNTRASVPVYTANWLGGKHLGSCNPEIKTSPTSAHFRWSNGSNPQDSNTGYLNTNLAGTDLAIGVTYSAKECAQLCDYALECVGWTYVKPGCATGNSCFLKSALGAPDSNPPVKSTCFVSNVKLGEVDAARTGSLILSFTNTSIYTTAQSCAWACEDNGNCRSWNFDRTSRTCSLYSNTPAATAAYGTTSGFRALVSGSVYYITNLGVTTALANDYTQVNNAVDPTHPRTYVASLTAPRKASQWKLISSDATRSTYMIQSTSNSNMCLDANYNVAQFGGVNTPWMNTCNPSTTTQRWQFNAQPFSQDLSRKFLYSIVAADYGLCLNGNAGFVNPQRDSSHPSPFLWNCTQDVLANMQWSVTIPDYGVTA